MERRLVLAVITGLLVVVFLSFIPVLGAVLAGLAAAPLRVTASPRAQRSGSSSASWQ